MAAGYEHTLFLLSDGSCIGTGRNDRRQCNPPPLDGGLTYVQVAAGFSHSLLLRSDGHVIGLGDVGVIPHPPTGQCYVRVAGAKRKLGTLRH